MHDFALEPLRALIDACSRIVVFTGAGISTESGISDYRSKGGLWERFQPVTIQEFLSNEEKRKEYWRRKKEMFVQMRDAKPNAGHLAIARLEASGKSIGVMTQNIDGLHQKAGSKKVVEIHGTNLEVICLQCEHLSPFDLVYDRLEQGEEIPLCRDCGGLLKPNTISFGQPLKPAILDLAVHLAQNCDLMLAVGSTLIVEPAASLPRLAKQSGARLAIVNREPTPLDRFADVAIHSTAGAVLRDMVP